MMAEFHSAAPVFRVSVLFMLTHTVSHRHGLLGHLNESEPSLMLLVTPVLFYYDKSMACVKKRPMCSTTRRKSGKINQSLLKVSSNIHHSSNNGRSYISGISRAVKGLLCWKVKAAENTKMKDQVKKTNTFLAALTLVLSL